METELETTRDALKDAKDGSVTTTVDADASTNPKEQEELDKLYGQLYGAGADSNQSGSESGEEKGTSNAPLSKKAFKKKQKFERILARKKEKKAEEKAAKKKLQEERKAELEQKLANMTEEEKLQFRGSVTATKAERKKEAEDKKQRMQQALEGGQKIVIDLDFDGKMQDNEMASLAKQLTYSYSVNSRSTSPCHLHLLGAKGGVAQMINSKCSGLENWKVTRSESTYMEHFGADAKDRLVYLTADADKELNELEADKIYIIGGLVDHNRYKNLCLKRAKDQGIATARLPLAEHIKLSFGKVLTVNHMVEILVSWQDKKDWAEVFNQVLPQRKRVREGGEEAGEGGEEVEGAAEHDAGGDHRPPKWAKKLPQQQHQ